VPPIALELAYILSGALFILGLKRLTSPATARAGNAMAAAAMLLAAGATLLDRSILTWTTLVVALIVGTLVGTLLARLVQMTAMPQLVATFNGFGGGASALVASAEFLRAVPIGDPGAAVGISVAIGVLVGTVTFSGSFIAFGKLQGVVTGRPVTWPLQRTVNLLIFLGMVGIGAWMVVSPPDPTLLAILAALAFVLGIFLVLPIGGADMPVVVSLLNSYSGLAASAAGFVIGNPLLILAGALVGAAGLILTQIMCKAMNRSLANVAFGAFGGGGTAAVEDGERTVRRTAPEEVALLLAYARTVVFVPGYGLAVAQAQHEVKKLTDLLRGRGVEVTFAIHPVAGRMPGHMNVLLAEADVPYDLLKDMDDANPAFERTDVTVVVGANDVVNPLAREPDSAIAGMPILDVDHSTHVVIIKRSLSPGFAGIDNPLFYQEGSMMLFMDAKEAISALAREVKEA
jgi:H+-translocating NAD(P) transhydrogenase subunit beta